MAITVKEVEHVAKLAQLRLSEAEKEKMAMELGVILEFIDQLKKVNVDGIEPTSHALPLVNVTRKDETKPSPPVSDVLANAPLRERGHFKVPRIME